MMFKQSSFHISLPALCLGFLTLVMASQSIAQASWSSDPQAVQTQEAAKIRYDADKRLCVDEASSEARIQCRRDALAVYDKTLAGLRSQGVYATQATATDCTTCARVRAVTVAEKAGESNAVGLIAGGVAGAVLGHQVGGGFGKDLATVAGAAGGAYAGKKIQENMGSKKVWTVAVQYADGRRAKFHFSSDPGFQVGDAVKNSGRTIVRN